MKMPICLVDLIVRSPIHDFFPDFLLVHVVGCQKFLSPADNTCSLPFVKSCAAVRLILAQVMAN